VSKKPLPERFGSGPLPQFELELAKKRLTAAGAKHWNLSEINSKMARMTGNGAWHSL